MEQIYSLLEKMLPFEWISYDFMKNALLAVFIITPLFGILGTMIVNKKMAFFSDALGHSALTGIAVGIILGVSNTNISMVLFAVFFALLLNWIKSRNTLSNDTIISVFSSLSTAIGLMILSKGGNFAKYSGLLVGDILSVTPAEIGILFAIFVITVLFWMVCYNMLHSISVNTALARTRGVRVKLLENLFAILIAIIVMLCIKWVGILIINALLILPAAAARNFASNVREYHLFAILISMFSGITGLILSYYNDIAAGPTIVVIAAILFFFTLLTKPLVK